MQLRQGRREWLVLAVILLAAAGLRLWRLGDNGFGTEYYAAGVRSMLQSPHLFFYGSFDPAGYISLDKPPLAFWLQAVFAWVFGFDGLVIHLPQALLGTASVAILYRLVRPYFGAAAALIGAAAFAIAPIAVAIDRSNNTDPLLVFFLLLSAGAALRGSGRGWLAAMVLLGLAFNVKMLAALVCGPALLAAWLLATQLTWPRRVAWLALGGVALIVVSLSWAVAFDLTPPDQRPYAGSTQSNSMIELILIHNGLQRFVRPAPAAAAPASGYELYDSVPAGPLRLAQPNLAGQFAWFLPLAVMGAILGWRRHRASIALWSGWAVVYGIVFSAASGIFHVYYLSAMVPPLCALSGIGAVALWQRDRRWLAGAISVTALWQALMVYGHLDALALGDVAPFLAPPALGLVAALIALRWRWAALASGVALAALPLAWALSAIFAPGNLLLPSTSLARWLGVPDGRGPLLSRNFRSPSDYTRLDEFLIAHRGSTRFAMAAPGTRLVAPFIIQTGAPAMAIGGYTGEDPVLSLDMFKAMVERGALRFVLLQAPTRASAAAAANRPIGDIARWVRMNGKPVDEALWRSQPPAPRRLTLYDLRPDLPPE